MAESNSRGQIIGACIGAAALIVVALIQFHPWSLGSTEHRKKGGKVLAGTVVESGTNRSIDQADITIVGRNDHYYTEGNGNFRITINGDSVENVRIRVTKSNYVPFDMTYDLPNESVIIPLAKEK